MKRRTVLIRILGALAIVAAVSVPAFAQSPTGSIIGNVVDGNGGALSGATVTASNVDTGATKTATSGATGNFTFPLLPVGRYSVASELQGFSTAKVSNVTVSIGAQEKVTLKMDLAGVQAAVTVSTEAPLIEATQSQQESVVGQKLIENLPTNGP